MSEWILVGVTALVWVSFTLDARRDRKKIEALERRFDAMLAAREEDDNDDD